MIHSESNKILFFLENKNNFQTIKSIRRVSSVSTDDNVDISIIGVNKLFDSSTSWSRKILWILSLLLCCSIVAYYVSMRVFYILSLPTQVAVSLQQNETLQLPSVTICPARTFVPSKLEGMGMTFSGLTTPTFALDDPFNVTNLWIQLAPPPDFIAVTVVNMETSRQNWQLHFSTRGVCYTHKYSGTIQASGLNFGMQIQFNWNILDLLKPNGTDTIGLHIFVHAPNDDPLTELEGIPIGIEDVSVAIRIKQFQSLSRKEHPCQKRMSYSKSKCVNKCFNNALHHHIKCKLPFMSSLSFGRPYLNSTGKSQPNNQKKGVNKPNNTTSKLNLSHDEADWCDTRDKYDGGFSKFWNDTKTNLTLWAVCGQSCLIECKKFVYTPYIESVTPSSKTGFGKLTIYFPEMWYEIVSEKEAYDLIALLCDVGGTFGLFLGCSILTLIEIVELAVIKIHWIFLSRKN